MNTCPDCKNKFVEPFRCTTCGAQRLYDETVRSQAAQIGYLQARVADLEEGIILSIRAMRAPLDGWKGVVERVALDAANKALRAPKCRVPEHNQ